MQLPQKVEYNGIKVLTTKQISEAYETKEVQIHQNFKNNRCRFVEGKHYISLAGDALKAVKKQLEKIEVVKNRASHLYLWTEKGALLHAKSLNTDKAWQVYDYLVDFYFRAKESKPEVPAKKEPAARPMARQVVDVPENPDILNAIQKIKDDLTCMAVLLDNCKMYIPEEEYYRRKRAAEDAVSIIVNDCIRLQSLKPRLVRKQM